MLPSPTRGTFSNRQFWYGPRPLATAGYAAAIGGILTGLAGTLAAIHILYQQAAHQLSTEPIHGPYPTAQLNHTNIHEATRLMMNREEGTSPSSGGKSYQVPSPRDPTPRPSPRSTRAIVMGRNLLLALVAACYGFHSIWHLPPAIEFVVGVFIGPLAVFSFLPSVLRYRPSPDPTMSTKLHPWALGLFISALGLIVNFAWNILLFQLGLNLPKQNLPIELGASSLSRLILYGLAVICSAGEEFLFRFALYEKLKGRWGPRRANLIQAGFFMGAHYVGFILPAALSNWLGLFQTSWIAAPLLFAAGILCGLAYQVAGLRASIIAHAAVNAIALLNLFPPLRPLNGFVLLICVDAYLWWRVSRQAGPQDRDLNRIEQRNETLDLPADVQEPPHQHDDRDKTRDFSTFKGMELYCVHATDYYPEGNRVKTLMGAMNGKYARNTIHWALNTAVASHEDGDWEGKKFYIVVKTQDLVDANPGKVFGGTSVDFFFDGGKEENLTLPLSARVFASREEVEAFLRELGVLQPSTKDPWAGREEWHEWTQERGLYGGFHSSHWTNRWETESYHFPPYFWAFVDVVQRMGGFATPPEKIKEALTQKIYVPEHLRYYIEIFLKVLHNPSLGEFIKQLALDWLSSERRRNREFSESDERRFQVLLEQYLSYADALTAEAILKSLPSSIRPADLKEFRAIVSSGVEPTPGTPVAIIRERMWRVGLADEPGKALALCDLMITRFDSVHRERRESAMELIRQLPLEITVEHLTQLRERLQHAYRLGVLQVDIVQDSPDDRILSRIENIPVPQSSFTQIIAILDDMIETYPRIRHEKVHQYLATDENESNPESPKGSWLLYPWYIRGVAWWLESPVLLLVGNALLPDGWSWWVKAATLAFTFWAPHFLHLFQGKRTAFTKEMGLLTTATFGAAAALAVFGWTNPITWLAVAGLTVLHGWINNKSGSGPSETTGLTPDMQKEHQALIMMVSPSNPFAPFVEGFRQWMKALGLAPSVLEEKTEEAPSLRWKRIRTVLSALSGVVGVIGAVSLMRYYQWDLRVVVVTVAGLLLVLTAKVPALSQWMKGKGRRIVGIFKTSAIAIALGLQLYYPATSIMIKSVQELRQAVKKEIPDILSNRYQLPPGGEERKLLAGDALYINREKGTITSIEYIGPGRPSYPRTLGGVPIPVLGFLVGLLAGWIAASFRRLWERWKNWRKGSELTSSGVARVPQGTKNRTESDVAPMEAGKAAEPPESPTAPVADVPQEATSLAIADLLPADIRAFYENVPDVDLDIEVEQLIEEARQAAEQLTQALRELLGDDEVELNDLAYVSIMAGILVPNSPNAPLELYSHDPGAWGQLAAVFVGLADAVRRKKTLEQVIAELQRRKSAEELRADASTEEPPAASTASVFDPFFRPKPGAPRWKWLVYGAYTVAGAALWETLVFQHRGTYLGLDPLLISVVFAFAHTIVEWWARAKELRKAGTPWISGLLQAIRETSFTSLAVRFGLSLWFLSPYQDPSITSPWLALLMSVVYHAAYNVIALTINWAFRKFLGFSEDALPVASILSQASADTDSNFVDLEELVGYMNDLVLTQPQSKRPDYLSEWLQHPSNLPAILTGSRKRYKKAMLRYHRTRQSKAPPQAVLELVSNGMDAVGAWISRFGLGFYQVLGELESMRDRVFFAGETAQGQSIGLVFRRNRRGRLRVRPMAPTELRALLGNHQQTTVVYVQKRMGQQEQTYRQYLTENLQGSRNMPVWLTSGRQRYLLNPLDEFIVPGKSNATRTYLHDQPIDVKIHSDGYLVTNPGFLAPDVLFEKLPIPRQGRPPGSERARQERAAFETELLMTTARQDGPCRLTVQVAGIGVETFELEGIGLPNRAVINLPPTATLNASRDQVIPDAVWEQAMSALLDQLEEIEEADHLAMAANVILSYWTRLADRSREYRNTTERVQEHLRPRIRQLIRKRFASAGARHVVAIPALAPFLEMRLGDPGSRPIYLHPDLIDFEARGIAGLEAVAGFRSSAGYRLYHAEYQPGHSHPPILRVGRLIVLDRAVYEWALQSPWRRALVNWWLTFQVGYGEPRPEFGWWGDSVPAVRLSESVLSASPSIGAPHQTTTRRSASDPDASTRKTSARFQRFEELVAKLPVTLREIERQAWITWMWLQLYPRESGKRPATHRQVRKAWQEWQQWARSICPTDPAGALRWIIAKPVRILGLDTVPTINPEQLVIRPFSTRLPDGRLVLTAVFTNTGVKRVGSGIFLYPLVETHKGSGIFFRARQAPQNRWPRRPLQLVSTNTSLWQQGPAGRLYIAAIAELGKFSLFRETEPGTGYFESIPLEPPVLSLLSDCELHFLPDGRLQISRNSSGTVLRQLPGEGWNFERVGAPILNFQREVYSAWSAPDGRLLLRVGGEEQDSLWMETNQGSEKFLPLALPLHRSSLVQPLYFHSDGRVVVATESTDHDGGPLRTLARIYIQTSPTSEGMRPLRVVGREPEQEESELTIPGALGTTESLLATEDLEGRLILSYPGWFRSLRETAPGSGLLRPFSTDGSHCGIEILPDGRLILDSKKYETAPGADRFMPCPFLKMDEYCVIEQGFVYGEPGNCRLTDFSWPLHPPRLRPNEFRRAKDYLDQYNDFFAQPENAENLRRFVLNMTQFGSRSVQFLELIPFLEPNEFSALREETLHLLNSILRQASMRERDRCLAFVRIAARSVPGDPALLNRYTQRWAHLVRADLDRTKVNALLSVLESGGSDLLRPQADPTQAPPQWQGFLRYLKEPQAMLLPHHRPEEEPDYFSVRHAAAFRLSQHVTGRRLTLDLLLTVIRSARRQLRGTRKRPLSLQKVEAIVDENAHRVDSSAEADRIRRTIQAQADGHAVWIRELIQNARDELRRANKRNETIRITTWLEGDQRVVRISDPIGMSLEKLLLIYFPIDVSDKPAGLTGKLGQGNYSVWLDASRVRIRTGDGNGKSYLVELVATRRSAHGIPEEIAIERFEEYEDGFKGTVIEHVRDYEKDDDSRYLEAAQLQFAIHHFLGDIRDVRITFQSQPVGEKVIELAHFPSSEWDGEFGVGWTDGTPRVTSDGLEVHPLTDQDWEGVPRVIRLALESAGRVLMRWPAGVPLTQPRNEEALREMDAVRWQRLRLATIFFAVVEALQQFGAWIPDLPQDLLWRPQEFRPSVYFDARAMNEGRWHEVDFLRYAKDENLALELVMLLRGRRGRMSLNELRRDIDHRSNEADIEEKLGDLFPGMRYKIREAVERKRLARAEDKRLEEVGPQPRRTLSEAGYTRFARFFSSYRAVMEELDLANRMAARRDAAASVSGDEPMTIQISEPWAQGVEDLLERVARDRLSDESTLRSMLRLGMDPLAHEHEHTKEFRDVGRSSHQTHQREGVLENSFPQRMQKVIEKALTQRWDLGPLLYEQSPSNPTDTVASGSIADPIARRLLGHGLAYWIYTVLGAAAWETLIFQHGGTYLGLDPLLISAVFALAHTLVEWWVRAKELRKAGTPWIQGFHQAARETSLEQFASLAIRFGLSLWFLSPYQDLSITSPWLALAYGAGYHALYNLGALTLNTIIKWIARRLFQVEFKDGPLPVASVVPGKNATVPGTNSGYRVSYPGALSRWTIRRVAVDVWQGLMGCPQFRSLIEHYLIQWFQLANDKDWQGQIRNLLTVNKQSVVEFPQYQHSRWKPVLQEALRRYAKQAISRGWSPLTERDIRIVVSPRRKRKAALPWHGLVYVDSNKRVVIHEAFLKWLAKESGLPHSRVMGHTLEDYLAHVLGHEDFERNGRGDHVNAMEIFSLTQEIESRLAKTHKPSGLHPEIERTRLYSDRFISIEPYITYAETTVEKELWEKELRELEKEFYSVGKRRTHNPWETLKSDLDNTLVTNHDVTLESDSAVVEILSYPTLMKVLLMAIQEMDRDVKGMEKLLDSMSRGEFLDIPEENLNAYYEFNLSEQSGLTVQQRISWAFQDRFLQFDLNEFIVFLQDVLKLSSGERHQIMDEITQAQEQCRKAVQLALMCKYPYARFFHLYHGSQTEVWKGPEMDATEIIFFTPDEAHAARYAHSGGYLYKVSVPLEAIASFDFDNDDFFLTEDHIREVVVQPGRYKIVFPQQVLEPWSFELARHPREAVGLTLGKIEDSGNGSVTPNLGSILDPTLRPQPGAPWWKWLAYGAYTILGAAVLETIFFQHGGMSVGIPTWGISLLFAAAHNLVAWLVRAKGIRAEPYPTKAGNPWIAVSDFVIRFTLSQFFFLLPYQHAVPFLSDHLSAFWIAALFHAFYNAAALFLTWLIPALRDLLPVASIVGPVAVGDWVRNARAKAQGLGQRIGRAVQHRARRVAASVSRVERLREKVKRAFIDVYRRANKTKDVEEIENGKLDHKRLYARWILVAYDQLRLANYAETSGKDDPNIHEVTGRNSADVPIEASEENGWHFRLRKGWVKPGSSIDRLSVNAHANPELIKALDRFIATRGIQANYKTPADLNDWLSRHDPITIYFYEPLPAEIEQEIAAIVQPYIRSTEDVLPGRVIIPGLVAQKSPTSDDLERLIARAATLDPDLGEVVRQYVTGWNRSKKKQVLKASAGQAVAVERVLDEMERMMQEPERTSRDRPQVLERFANAVKTAWSRSKAPVVAVVTILVGVSALAIAAPLAAQVSSELQRWGVVILLVGAEFVLMKFFGKSEKTRKAFYWLIAITLVIAAIWLWPDLWRHVTDLLSSGGGVAPDSSSTAARETLTKVPLAPGPEWFQTAHEKAAGHINLQGIALGDIHSRQDLHSPVQVAVQMSRDHPISQIARDLIHVTHTDEQLNALARQHGWGWVQNLVEHPPAHDPGVMGAVFGDPNSGGLQTHLPKYHLAEPEVASKIVASQPLVPGAVPSGISLARPPTPVPPNMLNQQPQRPGSPIPWSGILVGGLVIGGITGLAFLIRHLLARKAKPKPPATPMPLNKAQLDADTERAAGDAGLWFKRTRNDTGGWKLHLNVDHNPDLAQRIGQWLDASGIPYKIGRSDGQEGKGMTVYVGARDAAETVAAEINRHFGAELPEDPGKDVRKDDVQIVGKVWGRFDTAERGGRFHQYGRAGRPWLEDDMATWNRDPDPEKHGREADARAEAALIEEYGAFYTGTRNLTPEVRDKLTALTARQPGSDPTAQNNTSVVPAGDALSQTPQQITATGLTPDKVGRIEKALAAAETTTNPGQDGGTNQPSTSGGNVYGISPLFILFPLGVARLALDALRDAPAGWRFAAVVVAMMAVTALAAYLAKRYGLAEKAKGLMRRFRGAAAHMRAAGLQTRKSTLDDPAFNDLVAEKGLTNDFELQRQIIRFRTILTTASAA